MIFWQEAQQAQLTISVLAHLSILRSNGLSAQPSFVAPAAAGSSIFLISSQTVSAQASIVVTSGITSTYNNYMMVFSNVTCSSSTQNLQIQISTNGGSSYIATGYTSGYLALNYNSNATSNANLATGLLITNQNTSVVSANGIIYLCNLTSSSGYITCSGQINKHNPATPKPSSLSITGSYNTASQTVNALQVIWSSGTISGTVTLFGVLE